MVKHFISVCIVCFLCATHLPCGSHAELRMTRDAKPSHNEADNPPISEAESDDARKLKHEEYMERLFALYGDGKKMSLQGFGRLLESFDLMARQVPNSVQETARNNSNSSCVNESEIIGIATTRSNGSVDRQGLQDACPAILHSMLVSTCRLAAAPHAHLAEDVHPMHSEVKVPEHIAWFYSTVAVVAISACGVLALGVVPVMQKRYYQALLQFLVALAVGTLAGDALLHLMPHAMIGSGSHDHAHSEHHQHDDDHQDHDENMWKGVVAMLGLVFFFFMERVIIIVAKWRNRRQMKQKLPKVKVMKSEGQNPPTAAEKQCKHKYSSIPYCYDAIAKIDTNQKPNYPVFRLAGGGQDNNLGLCSDTHSETTATMLNESETNQNMTNCPVDGGINHCTEVNKMASSEQEKEDANSAEYTVILREHENKHHGHSHAHGHVHAAPKTMSSVAWMVIMGDGLHNFTDGMAIGAAFSMSIGGGFSTAVAVFCHELPHELGDFAMLLKAGMTTKQALFYNLLSSVLCFLGNTMGVWLGNTKYASSWVFAAAAGMFLYIALVDMMPELSSGHEEDGSVIQAILQVGGLLTGFMIMMLIALYEHDLKNLFVL